MALVLRRLGRVELARTFHRDVRNRNDYFHFAVGRTEAWIDETSPEIPIDNDSYVSKFRRSMMFTQQIDSADVCLLAKRVNWATGTVYDEYDDNISSSNQSFTGASNLADALFFVVTDEFKVYKCISNNNNGQSTVKPTSTGTSVFELADNYNWKFMFQISASDQNKFLDADFIPVRKLTGNPTHDVTGEVDSITITAGGTGYTSVPTVVIQGDGDGLAAGTATISGGAVTGVTITASGSGYSFAFITFSGGGGSGAAGSVNLGDADALPALQSAVEGAAVSGTLDRVIVTTAGQDYAENDVQVTVTGDGTGAEASAKVNAATGAITSVRVTNPGSGYSYAEISIVNTSAPGTGATARAIVSPQGGHGSNAPRELFANNLGVTVSFADNDNRDLILGNDFRQIALIKNIKTPAGVVYTTNTATACHIINVASVASYAVDDIITTDDGGSFTVIQIDSDNKNIYLTSTIPLITTNSVLTNTTQNISNLSINSITEPEVDNATGEVIYLDNRSPVIRSADQVEQIKALIRF
tara:strand:- start:4161 stop:5747 length:1587 start_codon:yes stop_codon:yes gene_type:complete